MMVACMIPSVIVTRIVLVGAGNPADIPALVIVGDADGTTRDRLTSASVVSLIELFGERRAFAEPQWCIEQAVRQGLAGLS